MEPQPPTTVIRGNFPKFRIWDEDKKKFYFSTDTIVARQEETSIVTPFAIPMDYKVKDNFVVNITEFTGILDSTKELRPIYTGDIVILTKDGTTPIGKGVAKWIPAVASFNVSLDLMNGLKIIILGNIFENEDILKQPLPIPQLDLSGNITKAINDTKKLPN